MAFNQEKRQRIEDLVLGTISRLERGDENTKRYKAFFKGMSDAEFEKWANGFQKDGFNQVFQIFVEPFNEPRIGEIEEAAKFLGIELNEYIYFRDQGERLIRSRNKVPVGYVPIKRVQQLLSKKNHFGLDNEERSLASDQVTGESKVASLSDIESSSLTAIDADRSLEEFLGFRSDDAYGKMQAYKQVINQGYISLDEIEKNQKEASQTAQTIDTYLLCSGIKTDLVNSYLKTRFTIEKELKEKKENK